MGFLYGRGRVLPSPGTMAFGDHARELRARLGRLALVFLFWSSLLLLVRFEPRVGLVPYAVPVFDIFDNAASRVYVALASTIVPEGVRLLVSRPMEAAGAVIQLALLIGFVLTLPALLYEAWAFLSPGMTGRERRWFARILPVAGFLFVAGAAFAYLFVVPYLFTVFYAFAAPLGAEQYLAAGALVGTIVTFALVFGLMFELPLVMVALVRLRITTPRTYIRYWRHATIAAFALAAFVTDPTLLSQLIVGVLLLLLYWSGVAVSALVAPAATASDAPGAAAS